MQKFATNQYIGVEDMVI